jgi:hypothetical protein
MIMINRKCKSLTLFFTVIPVLGLLAGCARETIEQPSYVTFFNHVKDLCGTTYEGVSEYTLTPDHPLAGAHLVMHIESCSDNEIRIPFYVNDDSSRTWVLTLSDEGLLLKHDHRHTDGSPEDTTMYGGWARPDGTPYVQFFPADDFTKETIPDASTNVWMMEINPETEQFVYYLERNDKPRFKAVFDMRNPLRI